MTSWPRVTRPHGSVPLSSDALREQLKTVARDLKELRRSPAGQLIKDMRRTAKAGGDPLSAIIAEIHAEVARAKAARDFVLQFRDGRMSLNEFVLGPEFLRPASSRGHRAEAARETEGDGGSFVDFMNQLFEEAGEDPAAPRRRGRRGSSRNAKRSGGMPF
jgi:hypothetical protein